MSVDHTRSVDSGQAQADVLLVTATQTEADALLDAVSPRPLRELRRHFVGNKTYFDLGSIGGARVFLTQTEMGSGGPSGSLLTMQESIAALNPSAVVLIGIAFGVDPENQAMGDILVSRQLLGYELQRVGRDKRGKTTIRLRGDRPQASSRLLDRFRSGVLDWSGAPVRFGLILSGEKLIDNQGFRDQLLRLEPEAIGGEMEGAGLDAAAQRSKVDWIIVKAIADWADGSKRENQSERQQTAAKNAVEFVLHVLSHGGFSSAARSKDRPVSVGEFAPYTFSELFQNYIDRRARGFVGRGYLFSEIEGLISSDRLSSGYIFIWGHPGIGKSALMARLAQDSGYVYHFNIASAGVRTARQFMGNVCARLILHYNLSHTASELEAELNRAQVSGSLSSAFLVQLLSEAAQVARAAGEKVVVLVDALDEAEHDNADLRLNRLYLPPSLPEDVYFVITCRPDEAKYRPADVTEWRDIHIDKDDPRNKADVEAKVREFINDNEHRDVMSARIAAWVISENGFVRELVERSEGNFMYIVNILPDIRDGKLDASTIGSITNLPVGLRRYYATHWEMMSKGIADATRFEQYFKPVICMLGAVLSPVSAGQIAEVQELPLDQVRAALGEWRQFLHTATMEDATVGYYIYHTTFKDFLREDIGLAMSHDKLLRNMYRQAIRQVQTGEPQHDL